MVLAAFYDLHSNLAALEAVAPQIEQNRAELLLVGGDAARPKPRITSEIPLELPSRSRQSTSRAAK